MLPNTSNRASAVLPVGVKVERDEVFEMGEADIGSVSNVEGLLDDGATCICSARRPGALYVGGTVRHDRKLRASCLVCCRIARGCYLVLEVNYIKVINKDGNSIDSGVWAGLV